MESVRDRVVVITGATSGIGASTANLFAKYGARLVLTDWDRDKLESVGEQCIQQGLTRDKILLKTADLSNEASVEHLMDETLNYFKTIHVLINNAGTIVKGNVQTATMAQFDEQMSVNVRALVQLTKLAIPYLKVNKGSIVNMSSINSTRANVSVGLYDMSRASVDIFTSVLALELGPAGVRVNSVNPAIIRTTKHRIFCDGDIEQYYKDFGKLHPLQRCGEPEEVAQAILFLASDAASFITGVNLLVDGGITKTASWFNQEMEALRMEMKKE